MERQLSQSFCKSKVRHERVKCRISLWMFVWLNQDLNSALPWAKLTAYFPDCFPHFIYKQMYHLSPAHAHATQTCYDQHVMKQQSSLECLGLLG